MPKIGRMEYPEVSFSNALETVELVKTKNIKTVQGLAQELGYKTKVNNPGGTFYYKLQALGGHYGLITRERGNIALSPIGMRIAYPLNDADKQAAIRESIFHVEFLRALYEELGPRYGDHDFRPKLSQLTGASPAEIDAQAVRVEGLYRDAMEYVGAPVAVPPRQPVPTAQTAGLSAPNSAAHVAVPPTENPRDVQGTVMGGVPTFEGPVRNLHSPDGYFIRVRLDVEVIEEAIAVLTTLRNRVAHLSPTTGSTADGTPPESA